MKDSELKEKTAVVAISNEFNYVPARKKAINYSLKELLQWHYSSKFEKFIMQRTYPCMGAQAAVNGKTYALGIFESICAPNVEKLLADGLATYLKNVKNKSSMYMTYIAIFRRDYFSSELDFEKALWNLLTKLHHRDAKSFAWNSEVSHDPTDRNFSFSFMEKPFFMVGLHPKSSRASRRFEYTAIAFNLHEQFEYLKKKGRYQPLKDAIREKEHEFSGGINPMLTDFGEGLEAPQYSGRFVSKDWKCPFNFEEHKKYE